MISSLAVRRTKARRKKGMSQEREKRRVKNKINLKRSWLLGSMEEKSMRIALKRSFQKILRKNLSKNECLVLALETITEDDLLIETGGGGDLSPIDADRMKDSVEEPHQDIESVVPDLTPPNHLLRREATPHIVRHPEEVPATAAEAAGDLAAQAHHHCLRGAQKIPSERLFHN